MTITNEIFEAFLRCPTKCFLQAEGAIPTGNVYAEWVQGEVESYRVEGAKHLTKRLSAIESTNGLLDRSDFISATWRCALNSTLHSENLESHIDAIERLSLQTAALSPQFVPMRFVRATRPNNVDKLMLAFDALVLSEVTGEQVAFGRIIHGDDRTSLRIKTAALTQQVRKTIDRISEILRKGSAPELVLNRHCAECHFQGRCREQARHIDELSLFSGMSPEERDRHRRRGIFTINQLSYTFRPRRSPKRQAARARPHYFALQALAIRENTIYVDGDPQLPEAEASIYLDIEGLSTSGPYYLIGVLSVAEGIEQFHPFWADQPADEVKIFANFVELVSQFLSNHPKRLWRKTICGAGVRICLQVRLL